ncbi:MAG: hypothetical protein A2073_04230 [Deltaproteobacteria bacterium GWC2_42_11]|nr:MAG: hypothetical protein A2073_04230 [Deltaproteobacteria bacterium GWC2_42_11]HBO84168.1 hypothetical protein [Deltaproteobacteria bacterium]
MNNNKGLTMIELLITIAIVGFMGIVSITYVPDIIDSYRVRGVARQIQSNMQMARLKAIKEGKRFAVEFTSATAYCVKGEVNTVTTLSDDFTDGCETTNTDDTILKNVNIASDYSGVNSGCTNNGRVVFNPNGTAGGCSNSITVSKSAGIITTTITITINTSTGNIRVSGSVKS